MVAVEPKPTFSGTPRYRVLRSIGAGGVGVVYEVLDARHGTHVALKTLSRLDPYWLARFKQEFRALADVVHPNLVQLYELECHEDTWFFTMELVRGQRLLDHLRGRRSGVVRTQSGMRALLRTPRTPSSEPSLDEAPTMSGETVARRPGSGEITDRAPPPRAKRQASALPDLARVRAALRQLASGIEAIHAAGKLHCDLKPNNVLVDPLGRVVILDFGLVTEIAPRGAQAADLVNTLAGTPAYMAPEQGTGARLTEAADWYALGVMLFELLAGRRPFRGKYPEILIDKASREAPDLAGLVEGVPEDLATLTMDLLRTDPAARPRGPEIVARLGGPRERPKTVTGPLTALGTRQLVGRSREMSVLHGAIARVALGKPACVLVYGASGMGKTELVRRFVDQVESDGGMVLEGRCYERELVPYKALDSMVDRLAASLAKMPPERCRAVLPAEIHALACLFPVIGAVEALKRVPAVPLPADPVELRRLAFAALRELLGNLARATRLVVYIDDLHFGDADSAPFLLDLVRPPDPPPLLLLLGFRTDGLAATPLVEALQRSVKTGRGAIEVLEIAPLEEEASRRLARKLLGVPRDGGGEQEQVAERIAKESRGSPFYIGVLAQAVLERGAIEGEVSLDGVLLAMVSSLPSSARTVLELVAVAGQPIREDLALIAADLGGEGVRALTVLRTGRLIRATGTGDDARVEPYHERVRELVLEQMAETRVKACHRMLAGVLGAAGEEPHVIAFHLAGAGDRKRAAELARAAAARAAESLAFDRAASLYRWIAELDPPSGDAALELEASLAEALSNAGRGKEAAESFLRASTQAPPERAMALRGRAAAQYLLAGYVDEGVSSFAAVTREMGARLDSPRAISLLKLIGLRLLLAVRGLRTVEKPEADVSPRELARIDVYWSVARGLSLIDPLRSVEFHTRRLLLALRAGEPVRVARALTLEACNLELLRPRKHERVDRMFEVLERIAERTGSTDVRGRIDMARGMVGSLRGEWRSSRAAFETAAQELGRVPGSTWEVATSTTYALVLCYYLGDYATALRRQPRLITAAEERGDVWSQIVLKTSHCSLFWLVQDDTDAVERNVADALRAWSHERFSVQEQWVSFTRGSLALYRGDGLSALNGIGAAREKFERSLLRRVPQMQVDFWSGHARAFLCAAAGASGAKRDEHLGEAARLAARLESMPEPYAVAHGIAVRAGVVAGRGDAEGASKLLLRAEQAFTACDMAGHAHASARRRGELTGGEQGRALISAADAWFAGQGVAAPQRFAALLVPLGR